MKESKPVTLRQYAKMCDTSHQTVSAAIEKGRIVEGYDPEAKKIWPELADLEWGLAFRAKRINKRLAENIVTQDRLDDLSEITVAEMQIDPHDTIGEAERKKLIIQSQRELIKLKTESGELVNREAMYREMFEFGKEIRMGLQVIPDRIIDRLITLPRNEAHKLLVESINEALEKLSNEESN